MVTDGQGRPVVTVGGREPVEPLTEPAGWRNMQVLIQLRWIALVGQVGAIVFVDAGLGVKLPLVPMGLALACLLAFNLFSQFRWRERRAVSANELLVSLLVDVAVLTVLLYCSGGARNPFVYLYLLQVTLGGALLPAREGWTFLGINVVCAALLTQFYWPLSLISIDDEYGPDSLFVSGLLICLLLNAILVVVFLTQITVNQRKRDARLAEMRQRAAEEEHIVRMGLLASGAAHELSTPLATLSVILGDWRHMPSFRTDPERHQEIEDMQTQLDRCKTIVQGILQSAGELRGVAPEPTTISAFLADLAEAWRATRPETALICDNQVAPDREILADLALRQMIENILDNAREASPARVNLVARLEYRHPARPGPAGDQAEDDEALLEITVTDRGPGFDPAILAQIGKPYQSTKGRPGAGLGLFLAVNVARALGGSIEVSNRRRGGARVRMILPLAAISRDPDLHEPAFDAAQARGPGRQPDRADHRPSGHDRSDHERPGPHDRGSD